MGVWPGNWEFFVATPPQRVESRAQTWRMPVITLEMFPVGNEGGVNFKGTRKAETEEGKADYLYHESI